MLKNIIFYHSFKNFFEYIKYKKYVILFFSIYMKKESIIIKNKIIKIIFFLNKKIFDENFIFTKYLKNMEIIIWILVRIIGVK